MIRAGGHVLVYSLAAAASPLALTATFLVIRSARPRPNSIAFLCGYVFGTAIACGLGLVLGQAAVGRLESHETVVEVVTILLGVVLIVVGVRSRHLAPRPEGESSRATAILNGLGNVRPAAAFTMAGLLGFGGPKRLVLTFLAMASISEAGVPVVGDGSLVVVYVVIATSLVAALVAIVVVAGDRAAVILQRFQSWLTTHTAALRVWLSLGVGALLMADGLVRLFA